MVGVSGNRKQAETERKSVSCSVVSDSATPWTIAPQAPLSMGFPRQENWSGLPFPSPGDLPHPGTEPESPALAGIFFTTETPGKPPKARGSQWGKCDPKTGLTSWWVQTRPGQSMGEGRLYNYSQGIKTTLGSFPNQCLPEEKN